MGILSMPEWDAAEAVLVERSRKAIQNISSNHATEVCSCFAFGADYCYGDIVICFDTIDNSLLHAKRCEAQTLKRWEAAFRDENGWEDARETIQRNKLSSYNPHTREFAFPKFRLDTFPGLGRVLLE